MDKIEKLYNKSQVNFGTKLFKSCRTNDVKFVTEFAKSDFCKEYCSPSTIWQMIDESTENGHIDIVRCIFGLPNLINTVKKDVAVEMCLRVAFNKGDIGIIKCLVEEFNAELEEYPTARGCIQAIKNNHKGVIEYIYGELKQDKLIKRELEFSEMLGVSIESGNFEITKFLIQSPNLLDKDGNSYFYSNLKKMFLPEYHNQNDILNFFVFDLKLEKNNFIEEFLKENPESKIAQLFNLRELNKDLHIDLGVKENNSKKMKI